jgi:hypothetical protein
VAGRRRQRLASTPAGAAARRLPAEATEAEKLEGLLAKLLAERGQDSGASRPSDAVDELPAAGTFEPGDLPVEGGLPEAECLGGCEDAGVPGDDQQPG